MSIDMSHFRLVFVIEVTDTTHILEEPGVIDSVVVTIVYNHGRNINVDIFRDSSIKSK